MRQPEALPPDIAQLLERGAVVSEPPASVRERLRSRLSTSLVSPVAHLRPIARGAGTGLAAAFARNRVSVGALAGFVVGAAGMWALRGQAPAAPSVAVVTTSIPSGPAAAAPANEAFRGSAAVAPFAPAAAVPGTAAPEAPTHRFVRKARLVVAAVEAPVPVASNAGGPSLASIPPATSPSHWGLLAEGELLQKGRTAMVRGDTEGALEAVEEHANRFPHGKLMEEREALRIQVLVAEDRTPEARVALGSFEHDYPKSLLRPALEEAVGARIQ